MSRAIHLIPAFAIGWLFGWVAAHHEVSTECVRLGSFYVGKQTFVCTLKAQP